MDIANLKKFDRSKKIDLSLPGSLKVKEPIRKTIEKLKEGESIFKIPEKYEGISNKITKDWTISIEGSAYFGQINELEETREGLGMQMDINGFFLYGIFEEDELLEGIVINKKGHYYSYNRNKDSPDDRDYLNFCVRNYTFNEGDVYKGNIVNGYPNSERGFYFFKKTKFEAFPKCDLIVSQFKDCKPFGIARIYFRREENDKEDTNFPLDRCPEDELDPRNTVFKLKAKCYIEDGKVKRFFKIFLHGRTIFLNTPDMRKETFGIMYDYINRHVDYIGQVKNGDDTYGLGTTGFPDCVMYTNNLENCYEGPAYHHSTASSQFSLINWPLGEFVDKIAYGWVYMEAYGAMVQCTWDNEDTRLIRIMRVLTPDGGDYQTDDDKFTYMMENGQCSWARIDLKKYPFREKFLSRSDVDIENCNFYIYADKERIDHHLVNSLGFVVVKKDENGEETSDKFGKIFMGNAYNEGSLLTKFESNDNVTLHGDKVTYHEDSLNFSFRGEIRDDKLVNGTLEGSYCLFEGRFNDDVFIEGKAKFVFEGGYVFEGEFRNSAPNGLGTIHNLNTGEKITGEWKDGVLNPERKFMIATGDLRRRSIRSVLIETKEGNSIKDLEGVNSLAIDDCIIRTNDYSRMIFKGKALLQKSSAMDLTLQTEPLHFRLIGIRGEMVKRKIDRILMYSDQMHTENYYGNKTLDTVAFDMPYCMWVNRGEFNLRHDYFKNVSIDFFDYFSTEIDFIENRLEKIKKVNSFVTKSKIRKLIFDYYGDKLGQFYVKRLEEFDKGGENRPEFSFVNYNYWDQRFVIYLPQLEEEFEEFKLKRKGACKRFVNREAIIFNCQGSVSIGRAIDALLHGPAKRLYVSQSLILEQEGEFFGDHILNKGKITYRNKSFYKGFLKFGKRHGKGEIKFANGEAYSGDWFGGIKHGQGEYRWPNGDVYQGEFKLNMLWGEGALTLGNGIRFEGQFWKNDVQSGKWISAEGEELINLK